MSLTDKVIKNTKYHLISQGISFLSPLILTPVIISRIGTVDFGIYVLLLGFIGTFGLLDASISSSFVKFISDHYNRKESQELLKVINTGFFFYLIFSLLITGTGYLFSEKILSVINIPVSSMDLAVSAFHIALGIFFLSTTFNIFNSVIISLQKAYIGAIASMIVTALQFVTLLVLMFMGYGLMSILLVNLLVSILSVIITLFIAKRILPELKVHPRYLDISSFRKMGKFGLQMQVSRLATFASEKYDEFLLGAFTNITNVTLYNIGNKGASYGKLVPIQFTSQIAPVAAELNAGEEKEKLNRLFENTTKFLNSISIPIFVFLFVFAELFIFAWMGSGYGISSLILRILAAGYMVNFMFSVPGNLIIPNLGIPKYQMHEGLIYLSVNIVLSYFLIITYGITGAAIGNSISAIIAAVYIFKTSSKFFGFRVFDVTIRTLLKPILAAAAGITLIYIFYSSLSAYFVNDRVSSIITIICTSVVYVILYLTILGKLKYFNEEDIILFEKAGGKLPFVSSLVRLLLRSKNGNRT